MLTNTSPRLAGILQLNLSLFGKNTLCSLQNITQEMKKASLWVCAMKYDSKLFIYRIFNSRII